MIEFSVRCSGFRKRPKNLGTQGRGNPHLFRNARIKTMGFAALNPSYALGPANPSIPNTRTSRPMGFAALNPSYALDLTADESL